MNGVRVGAVLLVGGSHGVWNLDKDLKEARVRDDHVAVGNVARPVRVGNAGRQPRADQSPAPDLRLVGSDREVLEAVFVADGQVEGNAGLVGGLRRDGELPVSALTRVGRPPPAHDMRVIVDPRIRRDRQLALDRRPLNGAVEVLGGKGVGDGELRPWSHGVAELRAHTLGCKLLESVVRGRLSDAVLLDDHIGPAACSDDRAPKPLIRDVALDQDHARDERGRSSENQPFGNRWSRARAQLSQRDAADAEATQAIARAMRTPILSTALAHDGMLAARQLGSAIAGPRDHARDVHLRGSRNLTDLIAVPVLDLQ